MTAGSAGERGRGPCVPAGGDAPRQGAARERILDAAEHLFAVRGYAGTATKSIAEHAQVANGLVFYHFPSKRELFEALLAERGFRPQLRAILAGADEHDPRATLLTIATHFAASLRERRDLARIALQSATTADEVTDGFPRMMRAEVTSVADYLVRVIGPHRIDGGQARAMARALLASIVITILVVPLDGDTDEFLTDLVDVLLSGYPPDVVVRPDRASRD